MIPVDPQETLIPRNTNGSGRMFRTLPHCVWRGGEEAIPGSSLSNRSLLNIKQVMQQRHVSVWNAKDELPIEIDLGQDCRFHSVFACPILRQQVSDNNPPMKLVCGHVISKDALAKLTQVRISILSSELHLSILGP